MMVTSLLSRVTGKKFVGIAAGGDNRRHQVGRRKAGGLRLAMTRNLPYSQALALCSSCLGRWPSSASDLKRLNTNSTCQRVRYQLSTSTSLNSVAGKVVNTITYLAYSSVSGRSCLPFFEAFRRRLLRAIRIASWVLRSAQTRPAAATPAASTTRQPGEIQCLSLRPGS